MSRTISWSRGATIVVALLLLGAILGTGVARLVWHFKIAHLQQFKSQFEYNTTRDEFAIHVGDTLPDHLFEDLSSTPVRLSSFVHCKAWLSFIEPSCDACLEELYYSFSDSSAYELATHCVVISAGNPRYLADLRSELDSPLVFLYDHRYSFLSQFGITVFPTNVLVDSNLVVLSVSQGTLLDNEKKDAVTPCQGS